MSVLISSFLYALSVLRPKAQVDSFNSSSSLTLACLALLLPLSETQSPLDLAYT